MMWLWDLSGPKGPLQGLRGCVPPPEFFLKTKATPFFSMFRVGRTRDFGAGVEKKIRHTYMYIYSTCVL